MTGSLLLIGSIMLEPAFWRDIDGFVIGLIIMAIVSLFLFFPIAQSIFGIVCFRVLQKPHCAVFRNSLEPAFCVTFEADVVSQYLT